VLRYSISFRYALCYSFHGVQGNFSFNFCYFCLIARWRINCGYFCPYGCQLPFQSISGLEIENTVSWTHQVRNMHATKSASFLDTFSALWTDPSIVQGIEMYIEHFLNYHFLCFSSSFRLCMKKYTI
jgi:hypothetical protein